MNILDKLHQPENRKLEFKREFPARSNLLKTIVAFANGAGGELILGISDDDRKITGIDEPLLLEERISNLIYDAIRPSVSPYISILNVQGKEILIVQILAGNNKPYCIKSLGIEKGVYVRIGSTNRQATPDMIAELRRQSRGITFETEMDITKNVTDLEEQSLSLFFESIGEPVYINDTLSKWRILQKNNGDYFPTVAGLVLFGKSELFDYDFAGIRLTKFQGTTLTNISETREYAIPIISKIDELCRHVVDFLQKESYLEGTRRLERTIIPFYAVREVIVNAIVHRDYSIRGSSIKINVFDDRLEVISPGILFGNLDISDIGTGLSECRNRSIARIFRKLNLMEELGTGIARIYNLYQEKRLKKPAFLEHGQFFKAILPQEREYQNNVDRIYDIIKRSTGISASDIAKQMKLHHNTILRYLNQLIADGRIKKTGTGKNTIYDAM